MSRTRIFLIDGIEVRLDDISSEDFTAIGFNGMPDWQVSVGGILDPTIHRLIDDWFDHGFAGLELDEYLTAVLKDSISRRVK